MVQEKLGYKVEINGTADKCLGIPPQKKERQARSAEQQQEMAVVTETAKVRNLESSILFLQQEHASTLKSLHDEIRTLQKKNSELTFRLEMGPAATSPVLDDQLQSLTREHNLYRQDMETLARDKNKKIDTLEKQLKHQDKTFKDELRAYGSKLRKAHQELTSKADTIAELQSKLYSGNSDLPAARIVPTPPKDGAPRTRGSRKVIVPIEVKAMPDRPLSGSLRRDYVLDPTPFLVREGSPVEKRPHDPLPPINSLSAADRGQSPLVRRPETELVQLALTSAQKNDSWRPTPHSSNLK